MDTSYLDTLVSAYDSSFKFHNENLLMLSWYCRRILSSLRANGIKTLLSLGIGHKVVSTTLSREVGSSLSRYVIVEGSQTLIEQFRTDPDTSKDVELIHGLVESFETNDRFDAIEMGFVLEHVDDPKIIVSSFRRFVKPGGIIYVAVPNARSLHRLIGNRAGLLDDIYKLSSEDLQLGHQHYFDLASLTALLQESALRVKSSEGILLKPVTAAQLESLHLSANVINAFFNLGIDYPDIANALLIEAVV